MKLTFLLIQFALLANLGQAAVDLSDFFPYGMSAGDQELPANDDGSTNEISISPFVFPFVDHRETRLWLNNNGDISFAGAIFSFTPICGPLDLNSRMVAIFWTDINTGNGGNLYYRQTTERTLLQKAANDIIKRYPKLVGINLEWLFIATWIDVAPFAAPHDRRDTFQLILATDGIFSFALMYFNKIEYTNGLDGDAKVGFDVGDGVNFIMVDGSCTSDIGNITEWSNMNEPGKFVFRVDIANISTSACEDDGSYDDGKAKLRVNPAFIDTLGHVPVAFQGPCFSETAKVTCTFHDTEKGPIQTNGIVTVPRHNTPTVYCQTPYFFGLGRTNVDVTLTEEDAEGNITSSITYSAFLSVASLNPSVQFNVLLGEKDFGNSSGIYRTNHSLVTLEWDATALLLQNASSVDVTLIWFDADLNTMADLVTIELGIPNTGSAQVVYRGTLPDGIDMVKLARSFVAFAISPSQETTQQQSSTIYSGVRLFTSYLPSIMVISSIRQHTYRHFILSDAPQNLPSCPCTEAQARTDPNFVKQSLTPDLVDFFHPGASMSYRNSAPILGSTAGQQCVYDERGNLMVGVVFRQATIVSAGGTADKYSPVISILGHLYHDLVPWAIYCDDSDNWEACRKYYELRPSDNCNGYQPPRPSQGNGDPHITSFDGLQYTFNGAGEFLMVEGTAGASTDFAMQARMEQFGTTNASVFTAFVMKQGATRVQVQVSQTATVDVLVDGYPVLFNDPALMSQTFNKEVSVVALADDLSLMLVSTSSGISFIISTSPAEGVMAITASSSESNRGKLRGLLGNFDGNADNDYQGPDGVILHPDNATLYNTHFDFALKWMITEAQSLFDYPPGKTYASFARPDFVPKLELPDVSTMPQEAIDLCGTSMQCLFDYEATDGSIAVANLTLASEQSFNETIEIIQQIVLLCNDVGYPENGFAYFTAGIMQGSQVTFDCNTGYALNGSDLLECTGSDADSMHWNGSVPECVLLQCSSLDTFEHGQVLFSDGRLPGSEVTFSCDSGYELIGANSLICNGTDLATMTWLGDLPECRLLACPPIDNPLNGWLEFTNGFLPGSIATQHCDVGYATNVSSEVLECSGTDLASMAWNGTFADCIALSCSPLESPDHGLVELTNGLLQGSIAIQKCDVGFGVSDHVTLQCVGTDLASMAWNGTFADCMELTCPPISNPQNGNVSLTNGTSVGSIATFSCENGFALSGSPSTSCILSDTTGNAEWSNGGVSPSCLEVTSTTEVTNPPTSPNTATTTKSGDNNNDSTEETPVFGIEWYIAIPVAAVAAVLLVNIIGAIILKHRR